MFFLVTSVQGFRRLVFGDKQLIGNEGFGFGDRDLVMLLLARRKA